MDGGIVEPITQDGDGDAARAECGAVRDRVYAVCETGHDDDAGLGQIFGDTFGRLSAVGGVLA